MYLRTQTVRDRHRPRNRSPGMGNLVAVLPHILSEGSRAERPVSGIRARNKPRVLTDPDPCGCSVRLASKSQPGIPGIRRDDHANAQYGPDWQKGMVLTRIDRILP